jgi:hypothetical protein
MPRTARQSTIQLLGALLALGVITLLVWTTTSAAFLDQTVNPGNSFGTGDVVLTDDDTGIAMFVVDDLAPSAPVAECIVVTYDGSITTGLSDVRMFASGLDDPAGDGLGDHLLVTVEEGTGADFDDPLGSCNGFTASGTVFTDEPLSTLAGQTFATANPGTWVPSSAPESVSYRVTVALASNPPAAVEGDAVTVNFVWQVQTTP